MNNLIKALLFIAVVVAYGYVSEEDYQEYLRNHPTKEVSTNGH